jgi:hypothetical protein
MNASKRKMLLPAPHKIVGWGELLPAPHKIVGWGEHLAYICVDLWLNKT